MRELILCMIPFALYKHKSECHPYPIIHLQEDESLCLAEILSYNRVSNVCMPLNLELIMCHLLCYSEIILVSAILPNSLSCAAVILMIYAWRAVAWELTNWKKAVFSLVGFFAYMAKLGLASIFLLIGDPITALIRFIETVFYSIRSFYSGVVAFAPVQELATIIILTSIILAISETTVEKSVKEQGHLLTIAGVLGYLVVDGSVPVLLFWLLLLGLFCFSRFIQKKDNASAALPVAAAAAAVGEPWLRFLTIVSYVVLASSQLWKSPKRNTDEQSNIKLPLPLLWAGLAIGVHLAAKWVRYRHLTWMIV